MRVRTRLFPPLLLLLSLLLAPRPVAAQTGTIRGAVTDEDGRSLEGASVSVEGTGLGALTDAGGSYQIRDVPAGTHTVTVRLLGYAVETARIAVEENAVARLDFALRTEAIALEELVVLGSRARHTAAEELAVPVDIFTATEIRRQGTLETAQILEELAPSVNFPRQTVADATDIVRPFTLRGLSPDHTLVLLNGRRRHRTALIHVFGSGMGAGASGVDLNTLPATAIDRIEVLRDGAAAQYGSDAIAGVVNVALRKGAFDPVLTASVGRYAPDGFPDDGTVGDVGGAWGVGVGGGSIAFFAEYRDRDPTNRAGADPEDQIVPGDADLIDEDGGVVVKRNPVPQPNHHWGDGRQTDILGFVNAEFPLNEARTLEAYGFGGYSFREGEGNGFRRQGISDRNWPEIHPLGFLPTFDVDVTDWSGSGGVRGAAGPWTFDVGGSFGFDEFEYGLTNTLNTSLGPCLDVPCAPGPDGVLGTADDPGIPNQTEFFAGALKLDELVLGADLTRAFDVGGLAAPLNLAVGVAFRRETYEIEPGETASWIDGGHPNRNGEPAPAGSQVFPGFRPDNAVDEDRTNVGVYAELEASPSSEFLVNVAGRFETYSEVGDIAGSDFQRLTGKLALRWQPEERVVLRGAVSSGFRAPALSQSLFASTVTNFVLDEATGQPVPFEVGIFPVGSEPARVLGAEPLKDETSINVSGGFALTPVDRLTVTADYFFVRIADRIILTSEIGGEEIERRLAEAGLSVQAGRFFTNALDTRTQGVDIVGRYEAPAGEEGTITLSGGFNWTKNEVIGCSVEQATEDISQCDIEVPPELEGTGAVLFEPFLEGGLIALTKERPEWRGTLEAVYGDDRLSLLGRTSLWGPFTSPLLGVCGPECVQDYGWEGLVDAEVGYRFTNQVTLAVGAKNIFDNFPDRMIPDNSFGIFLFPSASPFGFNGRYLYARTEIRLLR